MTQTVRCDASFENRRKIVLVGLSAILFICITWVTLSFVFAAGHHSAEYQNASDIKKTIDSIVDNMADQVGNSLFNSVDEIANTEYDPDESTVARAMSQIRLVFNGNGSIINQVGNAIAGLGLVLSFFYAFIALIKELQRGDVTVDMWLKFGLIMGIAAVLIYNWTTLADGLDTLGSWTADKIKLASNAHAGTSAFEEWFWNAFCFGPDLEDVGLFSLGNIFTNIGKIFTGFLRLIGACIVWLVFQIPLIGIRVTIFAMVIEIYIRRAFIPLAIADVGGHGGRSAGVAYLKSYFGLYLRIGMCYLIARFGEEMMAAVLVGVNSSMTLWTVVPYLIIIYIIFKTALKLFNSTKQWSDMVMGR